MASFSLQVAKSNNSVWTGVKQNDVILSKTGADALYLGDTESLDPSVIIASSNMTVEGTLSAASIFENGVAMSVKYFSSNTGQIAMNVALAASNTAYPSSNVAYAASNAVYPTSNAAFFASNTGVFGSNVAVWASNTSTVTSNVAFVTSNITFHTSNAAFFASNTGVFGSNVAVWGSNTATVASNVVFVTSNAAFPASNAAFFASNIGVFGSNVAIWGSNTASVASNVTFLTSNVAYTTSNIAFAGNSAAIATSNLANVTSNAAFTGSNAAFFASNSALLKSGGTMTGQLTSTVAMGTAPFVVASSNVVANLNVSFLEGLNSTFLLNTSNAGYSASNVAFITSNVAYASSNAAFNANTVAFTGSNAAFSASNVAFTTSNVAYPTSNAAFFSSNALQSYLPLAGGSVTGNLTVGGNFTVSGTTTSVDTQTLLIKDNILTINSSLSNAIPPSTLQSGIEVRRGTYSNYYFVFDETSQLFKVGQCNQLQAVTTRDDNLATGFPYYDTTTSKLTTRAIGISDVTNLTTSLSTTSNAAFTGSNAAFTANSAAFSGSNAAFTGSNAAFFASNSALLKSGGTMNGQIQGSADTVSTPTFTWSGDSNTGLYHIGAGVLGFASKGNNVVTLSNSLMGIGLSNPTTPLHLASNAGNTKVPFLTLQNLGGGAGAEATVQFKTYNTTYAQAELACIDNNNGGDFVIRTKAIGADTNLLQERVRVTPAGNFGINTTNPLYTLDVAGTLNASNLRENGALLSTVYTPSNVGYTASNAAFTGSNVAFLTSNAAFTASNAAFTGSNAAFTASNVAFTGSNAAFFASNSALMKSGGTMTGQIQGVNADSLSAPTYTWSTDTSTGMYHHAANIIGFSAGGTKVMTLCNAGVDIVANAFHVGSNFADSMMITQNMPYGSTSSNRRYSLLATADWNSGLTRITGIIGTHDSAGDGVSKVDLFFNARNTGTNMISGYVTNYSSFSNNNCGIVAYKDGSSNFQIYVTGKNYFRYNLQLQGLTTTYYNPPIWSSDTAWVTPSNYILWLDTTTLPPSIDILLNQTTPTNLTYRTVDLPSSGMMSWGINNSNIMTMSNNNVGIRNINPAYTLDVTGSVNATTLREGGTALSNIYTQSNVGYSASNTAFATSNPAFTASNAAFFTSNNALLKSGGTMTGQLTSTVAMGTAPFVVASSNVVTNLNADFLDGYSSIFFLNASNINGGVLATTYGGTGTTTSTGSGSVVLSAGPTFTGTISASNINATGTVNVPFIASTSSGTAAAPNFTWSNDTNTGLYNPYADTIGITAGGVERLRITSNTTTASTVFDISGQCPFDSNDRRWISFISNNSNQFTNLHLHSGDNGTQSLLLYAGGIYGASAGIIQTKDTLAVRNNQPIKLLLNPDGGYVGVGFSNPATILHLASNAGFTKVPFLTLQNLGGGAGAEAALQFKTYNTSYTQAEISCLDNSNGGDFVIRTKPTGADTNALQERVRVTPSGNVGVNTPNPLYTLDVAGTLNASNLRENGALLSTVYTPSNVGYTASNAAFTGSNVAFLTSNAAFTASNAAFTGSNAAFFTSNSALLKSGGTMTGQLTSAVAMGTAPFVVTSSNVVANLNADFLDGNHATFFQNATNINNGLLSVLYGGTGTTTSTGTGSVVLNTAPTFTGTAGFSNVTTSNVLISQATGDAVLTIYSATPTNKPTIEFIRNSSIYGGDTSVDHRIVNSMGVLTFSSSNSLTGPFDSILALNGSNGFVGIWTSNPAYQFDVNGSFNATNIREAGILLSGSYASSNAGYSASNAAFTASNAAFFASNSALLKSGGTMTGQLTSTVAMGTAPFVVTSSNVVTNLNADYLDGYHATFLLNASNINGGVLATTYGGTGTTTSTGTGSVVLNTGPTFTGTITASNINATGTVNVPFIASTTSGTAAAPNFTWSNDTNTGLYNPSSDTIGIAAGGVERFRITSNTTTASTVFDISGQCPFDSNDRRWISFISNNSNQFTNLHLHSGDNGTQSLLLYAGGAYNVSAGIIQAKDTLPVRNNQPIKLLLNPDGGFVGVGFSNPSTILHLASNAGFTKVPFLTLQNLGGGAGAEAAVQFKTYNTSYTQAEISCLDNSNGGDFVIRTKPTGADSNALQERLRVTPGGNIGVATSNPAYTFDVAGTINASNIRENGALISTVYTPSNVGYTASNVAFFASNSALLKSGGTMTGQIQGSATDSVTAPGFSWSGDTNTGMYHMGAGAIGFASKGANVVTLSNSMMGVGVANPQYTAHIANTLYVNYLDQFVMASNNSLTIQGAAYSAAQCYVQSSNNGQNYFTLIRTSNVNNSGSLATASHLVLDPTAGNVGVGTYTPGYKLDVAGSVNATTVLQGGSNITPGVIFSSNAAVFASNSALLKSGGTMTGQIQGSATDSVSAPAFSWSGDTNTGMYHIGTGVFGFASKGTNIVTLSNSLMGLGTTTPSTILHLQSNAPGVKAPLLLLQNTGGGVGSGEAAVQFKTYPTSYAQGEISVVDNVYGGDMIFRTKTGGPGSLPAAESNLLIERMRITTVGNIQANAQIQGYSNDSASAPAFTWNADSNTGMYHIATGVIGLTSKGNSMVTFSNNMMGIGLCNATPSGMIHLTSNAGSVKVPFLILQNLSGGSGAEAAVQFRTFATSNTQAEISCLDNNLGGDLVVRTKTYGNDTNPLLERMRITTIGNVGIMNSNPQSTLDIIGQFNTTPSNASATATTGGPFYIQTKWDAAGTTHTLSNYTKGDNSAGTLYIQIANKSSSNLTAKTGNLQLSFIRTYGNNADIFTVASHRSATITTLSTAVSGSNIVITTDSDCAISWTSIGSY